MTTPTFNLLSFTDSELAQLNDLIDHVRKTEADSFEIYVSDTLDIDFEIGNEDQFEEAMAFNVIDHPYKTAELIGRVIDCQ